MMLLTSNEGWAGANTTSRLLAEGANALDAIEAGIKLVEAEATIRTVGLGGKPNLVGEVEVDAGIMDGNTLRTGAIGALRGYIHPITIARAVLDHLPHEIIVGEGAARFAAEIGAISGDLLTEQSRTEWEKWRQVAVPAGQMTTWDKGPIASYCRNAADPEISRGTTVFLAQDQSGRIAAGTSTSGWSLKYPGRLGDSPIVGAGFYADSRYGAAACTGAGELTIRCGTARMIVALLKHGASLQDAVDEAADELLAISTKERSRVSIHAIDAAGNWVTTAVNGLQHHCWHWGGTSDSTTKRDIENYRSSSAHLQRTGL